MLSFAEHFAHLATYSPREPTASDKQRDSTRRNDAYAAKAAGIEDQIVAYITSKGSATRIQIMQAIGITKGATTHRLISLVDSGRIKKNRAAPGSCAHLFEAVRKEGVM